MKLNVNDIEESPRDLTYKEPIETLNADLVHGEVQDFELKDEAEVQLNYHRSGEDLVFTGNIAGPVIGHCARCLEPYEFLLTSDFSFILVPKQEVAEDPDLAEEDLHLSFYQGEEVDLSPLVREQLILALPTKPLCSEDCKGLCPQCGVNRNLQTCDCREQSGDPRLAILKTLKPKH